MVSLVFFFLGLVTGFFFSLMTSLPHDTPLQLVLRLSQGSGSFDVDFQPPDMARVVYNAADKTNTVSCCIFFSLINSWPVTLDLTTLIRRLQVTPQADGLLRIVVSDRCLWARHVAVAEISVSVLGSVVYWLAKWCGFRTGRSED